MRFSSSSISSSSSDSSSSSIESEPLESHNDETIDDFLDQSVVKTLTNMNKPCYIPHPTKQAIDNIVVIDSFL